MIYVCSEPNVSVFLEMAGRTFEKKADTPKEAALAICDGCKLAPNCEGPVEKRTERHIGSTFSDDTDIRCEDVLP